MPCRGRQSTSTASILLPPISLSVRSRTEASSRRVSNAQVDASPLRLTNTVRAQAILLPSFEPSSAARHARLAGIECAQRMLNTQPAALSRQNARLLYGWRRECSAPVQIIPRLASLKSASSPSPQSCRRGDLARKFFRRSAGFLC